MRLNKEIRSDRVRVIDAEGNQLGVMTTRDALAKAQELCMDLIEVAPLAKPPVCKIIDYGKFKYHQAMKEKESKKAQHQVKVKEVKFSPNIDDHDLETKIKHAKEFLDEGNKVRFVCTFRGREMLHLNLGDKLMQRILNELQEVAVLEIPPKLMGRMMSLVIAPSGKKKK